MGSIELAGGRSQLPPRFDKLPILRKLHDARVHWRVQGRVMSVRDKNVAVRCDRNSRRSIEGVWTVPGDSGLAERQQDFSVRTELKDLVALSMFAYVIRCGAASDPVGHPHVSVLVHKDAVRQHEHTHAKIFQKLP